jgi:hypothetical protein
VVVAWDIANRLQEDAKRWVRDREGFCRVLVLSDCQGAPIRDAEQVGAIAEALRGLRARVDVVAMHLDEDCARVLDGSAIAAANEANEGENPTQTQAAGSAARGGAKAALRAQRLRNVRLLKQLVDGVGCGSSIQPFAALLESLQRQRKRAVAAVTKFRGDIVVGDLAFPVFTYAATAEERPPTLKKLLPGVGDRLRRQQALELTPGADPASASVDLDALPASVEAGASGEVKLSRRYFELKTLADAGAEAPGEPSSSGTNSGGIGGGTFDLGTADGALSSSSSSAAGGSMLGLQLRGREVHPTDLAKAFRYGREVLHVGATDEPELKWEADKHLGVLAFARAADIPLGVAMGGADLVLPAPGGGATAQQALSAFARALARSGRVALVRHVKRRGGAPLIGALVPALVGAVTFEEQEHPLLVYPCRAGVDCLYLVPLPFEDDIRPFIFPSLPEAAPEVLADAQALVAAATTAAGTGAAAASVASTQQRHGQPDISLSLAPDSLSTAALSAATAPASALALAVASGAGLGSLAANWDSATFGVSSVGTAAPGKRVPSAAELAVFDRLILAMDLTAVPVQGACAATAAETGDVATTELVVPESTFNPVLSRMHQAVVDRYLNPTKPTIPVVDAAIDRSLHPEGAVLAAAGPQVAAAQLTLGPVLRRGLRARGGRRGAGAAGAEEDEDEAEDDKASAAYSASGAGRPRRRNARVQAELSASEKQDPFAPLKLWAEYRDEARRDMLGRALGVEQRRKRARPGLEEGVEEEASASASVVGASVGALSGSEATAARMQDVATVAAEAETALPTKAKDFFGPSGGAGGSGGAAAGPSSIGTADPVSDYRGILARRDGDQWPDVAAREMGRVIRLLSRDPLSIEKALTCLMEFRESAPEYGTAHAFNDFLRGLKADHATGDGTVLWQRIVSRGVSLLSRDDTPHIHDVTAEDKAAFLQPQRADDLSGLTVNFVAAVAKATDDDLEDIE